jgi:hypothetical protein
MQRARERVENLTPGGRKLNFSTRHDGAPALLIAVIASAFYIKARGEKL